METVIDEKILAFYEAQVVDGEFKKIFLTELNLILVDFKVLTYCSDELGRVFESD